MNQIKSINLENFKSYKNQTFNISGLNVFCGNNSVGKSTVMQAIAMILQSDFGSKSDLKLNGDLINIGRIDDVFNDFTSAEDKLSITISTSNCEVRWGITKEDSTIIRNELPCISGLEDIETLKDFVNISNFQYIEAERIGPRDNIPLSQHNFHSDWLGKKGICY
ncbi:AAA family ATPase [Pectobacterium atrosepticum]|uniref:AAA family ATPase n=1 Tax=Pectobacterium atrosepticum TaxID=29471 RepID=UPI00203DBD66|nr:AAA family ATPase [Pectobacterium atrosepticum]